MSASIEGLFTAETLITHAPGVVIGAIGLALANKAGLFVFGKSQQIAVELSEARTALRYEKSGREAAEAKVEALRADLQDAENRISQYKAMHERADEIANRDA